MQKLQFIILIEITNQNKKISGKNTCEQVTSMQHDKAIISTRAINSKNYVYIGNISNDILKPWRITYKE